MAFRSRTVRSSSHPIPNHVKTQIEQFTCQAARKPRAQAPRDREGAKIHLFNSRPRWSTPTCVRTRGRAARAVFFLFRGHDHASGGDQRARSWELSTAVRRLSSFEAKGDIRTTMRTLTLGLMAIAIIY